MSAEVTIDGPFGRHSFSAARPAVLPLLCRRDALCFEDSWVLQFEGTREELIAAGLADAGLFVFGKSGTRAGWDDLGNHFDLRTMPGGQFAFQLRTLADDPAPERLSRLKRYRENQAAIEAQVDGALERMRRPRR